MSSSLTIAQIKQKLTQLNVTYKEGLLKKDYLDLLADALLAKAGNNSKIAQHTANIASSNKPPPSKLNNPKSTRLSVATPIHGKPLASVISRGSEDTADHTDSEDDGCTDDGDHTGLTDDDDDGCTDDGDHTGLTDDDDDGCTDDGDHSDNEIAKTKININQKKKSIQKLPPSRSRISTTALPSTRLILPTFNSNIDKKSTTYKHKGINNDEEEYDDDSSTGLNDTSFQVSVTLPSSSPNKLSNTLDDEDDDDDNNDKEIEDISDGFIDDEPSQNVFQSHRKSYQPPPTTNTIPVPTHTNTHTKPITSSLSSRRVSAFPVQRTRDMHQPQQITATTTASSYRGAPFSSQRVQPPPETNNNNVPVQDIKGRRLSREFQGRRASLRQNSRTRRPIEEDEQQNISAQNPNNGRHHAHTTANQHNIDYDSPNQGPLRLSLQDCLIDEIANNKNSFNESILDQSTASWYRAGRYSLQSQNGKKPHNGIDVDPDAFLSQIKAGEQRKIDPKHLVDTTFSHNKNNKFESAFSPIKRPKKQLTTTAISRNHNNRTNAVATKNNNNNDSSLWSNIRQSISSPFSWFQKSNHPQHQNDDNNNYTIPPTVVKPNLHNRNQNKQQPQQTTAATTAAAVANTQRTSTIPGVGIPRFSLGSFEDEFLQGKASQPQPPKQSTPLTTGRAYLHRRKQKEELFNEFTNKDKIIQYTPKISKPTSFQNNGPNTAQKRTPIVDIEIDNYDDFDDDSEFIDNANNDISEEMYIQRSHQQQQQPSILSKITKYFTLQNILLFIFVLVISFLFITTDVFTLSSVQSSTLSIKTSLSSLQTSLLTFLTSILSIFPSFSQPHSHEYSTTYDPVAMNLICNSGQYPLEYRSLFPTQNLKNPSFPPTVSHELLEEIIMNTINTYTTTDSSAYYLPEIRKILEEINLTPTSDVDLAYIYHILDTIIMDYIPTQYVIYSSVQEHEQRIYNPKQKLPSVYVASFVNEYCQIPCPTNAFCYQSKVYCPAPFELQSITHTDDTEQEKPFSLTKIFSSLFTQSSDQLTSQLICSDETFLHEMAQHIHKNTGLFECYSIHPEIVWYITSTLNSIEMFFTEWLSSQSICQTLCNWFPTEYCTNLQPYQQVCPNGSMDTIVYVITSSIHVVYYTVIRPLFWIIRTILSILFPIADMQQTTAATTATTSSASILADMALYNHVPLTRELSNIDLISWSVLAFHLSSYEAAAHAVNHFTKAVSSPSQSSPLSSPSSPQQTTSSSSSSSSSSSTLKTQHKSKINNDHEGNNVYSISPMTYTVPVSSYLFESTHYHNNIDTENSHYKNNLNKIINLLLISSPSSSQKNNSFEEQHTQQQITAQQKELITTNTTNMSDKSIKLIKYHSGAPEYTLSCLVRSFILNPISLLVYIAVFFGIKQYISRRIRGRFQRQFFKNKLYLQESIKDLLIQALLTAKSNISGSQQHIHSFHLTPQQQAQIEYDALIPIIELEQEFIHDVEQHAYSIDKLHEINNSLEFNEDFDSEYYQRMRLITLYWLLLKHPDNLADYDNYNHLPTPLLFSQQSQQQQQNQLQQQQQQYQPSETHFSSSASQLLSISYLSLQIWTFICNKISSIYTSLIDHWTLPNAEIVEDNMLLYGTTGENSLWGAVYHSLSKDHRIAKVERKNDHVLCWVWNAEIPQQYRQHYRQSLLPSISPSLSSLPAASPPPLSTASSFLPLSQSSGLPQQHQHQLQQPSVVSSHINIEEPLQYQQLPQQQQQQQQQQLPQQQQTPIELSFPNYIQPEQQLQPQPQQQQAVQQPVSQIQQEIPQTTQQQLLQQATQTQVQTQQPKNDLQPTRRRSIIPAARRKTSLINGSAATSVINNNGHHTRRALYPRTSRPRNSYF